MEVIKILNTDEKMAVIQNVPKDGCTRAQKAMTQAEPSMPHYITISH